MGLYGKLGIFELQEGNVKCDHMLESGKNRFKRNPRCTRYLGLTCLVVGVGLAVNVLPSLTSPFIPNPTVNKLSKISLTTAWFISASIGIGVYSFLAAVAWWSARMKVSVVLYALSYLLVVVVPQETVKRVAGPNQDYAQAVSGTLEMPALR